MATGVLSGHDVTIMYWEEVCTALCIDLAKFLSRKQKPQAS